MITKYVNLVLFLPDVPDIKAVQTSYNIPHGNDVTLWCLLSGVPNVTDVSWSLNSNTLAIDDIKYGGSTASFPSLTISNTDPKDTGTYTCYATNCVGTSSTPIELKITKSM